ncbi:MAG: DoxX family membrane protein [Chlamydiae bacterium]|nr:DoxX family membrane protein [Chlamydiota bacterium]
MKILWFVLRIGVGALFAYAGFSKLILPIENFEGILSQYEVIAHCLIHPIAFLLPWIEWMGGSLLILGFAPRLTSGILATVVFLFLMVLTSTLIIGGDANLNCGCFGEKIHLVISDFGCRISDFRNEF